MKEINKRMSGDEIDERLQGGYAIMEDIEYEQPELMGSKIKSANVIGWVERDGHPRAIVDRLVASGRDCIFSRIPDDEDRSADIMNSGYQVCFGKPFNGGYLA